MRIIKQPNGNYFVARAKVGPLKNATEQDIIDIYIEMAKEDIEKAEHYGKFIEANESADTYGRTKPFTDSDLKEMGFDKTYKELVKFIPRDPRNKSYAPYDFATYATCPTCGKKVQNGIGLTHEKCPECGQLLKW